MADLKKAGALDPVAPCITIVLLRHRDEKGGPVSFCVDVHDCYSGTVTIDHAGAASHGARRRYAVRLEAQKMRFGGVRWWFVCPYTRQRVAKIYKFDGIDKFCSRTAIRPLPTYGSQRVSGIAKILYRRRQLRRRLVSPTDQVQSMVKPKWMRWSTAFRLIEKDTDLEEQADAAIKEWFRRGMARLEGRVRQGI